HAQPPPELRQDLHGGSRPRASSPEYLSPSRACLSSPTSSPSLNRPQSHSTQQEKPSFLRHELHHSASAMASLLWCTSGRAKNTLELPFLSWCRCPPPSSEFMLGRATPKTTRATTAGRSACSSQCNQKNRSDEKD
uniref:Uncharacterized protein n=1 Tax=Aegilops tauschii subsp. strangulata TaxID=200361 RepID=A0A453NEJ7_AEGTS